MNFLDQLTRQQRTQIVSLPYRVGLWISESDTSGGAESGAKEMKALASILNGYTEDVFGSEVVQYVMSETVARKSEWKEWGKNLDRVPEECRYVISMMEERVDPKELSAFKQHLLEIGEAVALAFREYSTQMALPEKAVTYVTYYKGKIAALLQKRPYRSLQQFLNISATERGALSTLAHSLGTHYF